jgi:D-alanine transaminase
MPKSLACLNGAIMAPEEATVPIWDRGFLFGDAVYEVCRIYRGRSWLEDEHMARLRRSLAEMRIGPVDFARLARRMHETIAASGVEEGTIYVQITRGVAPRLHAFPDPPVEPTEVIVVRPYDDAATARLRESGVPVVSQPDWRWRRCDVKSTNLLANVLANQAAHEANAYEAVLFGPDGNITEATHSSLLWVRDGRLEGTPEGPGILPGTTRLAVLPLAASEGIPFAEATISLDDLRAADEILLSGTTIEVLPVVAIDGRPVGDGQPGPLTRRLQKAFRSSLDAWLARGPA